MDAALIARYAPGGDIYNNLLARYGHQAAEEVYWAAKSGDRTQVTDALVRVKHGQPLNDSVAEIFVEQITTDPLAAPLETANRQLGNLVAGLVKNPLAAVGIAVALLILIPDLRKFLKL